MGTVLAGCHPISPCVHHANACQDDELGTVVAFRLRMSVVYRWSHACVLVPPGPRFNRFCSFRAVQRSAVKRHETIHGNRDPLACEMCGYRAEDADGLTVHERREHGAA